MTTDGPRAFVARWEARRAEWARLGVLVDGAKLAGEVLHDFEEVMRSGDHDALTLEEAARESGYSVDHLRHLIADGQLANAGRKHAPRLRRVDLPRKPSAARSSARGAYDADGDAIRLVKRSSREGLVAASELSDAGTGGRRL